MVGGGWEGSIGLVALLEGGGGQADADDAFWRLVLFWAAVFSDCDV